MRALVLRCRPEQAVEQAASSSGGAATRLVRPFVPVRLSAHQRRRRKHAAPPRGQGPKEGPHRQHRAHAWKALNGLPLGLPCESVLAAKRTDRVYGATESIGRDFGALPSRKFTGRLQYEHCTCKIPVLGCYL